MTDPDPRPLAPGPYQTALDLERRGEDFVLVVLVEAIGSTPHDAGAKMIVTRSGRHSGTVGGGRIEARALEAAQALLADGQGPAGVRTRFVSWSLKADVGMTCGGSVKLYFEHHPATGSAWNIVIFGAGHVTQALVPVLLPLDCRVTVCDSRAEWLQRLPPGANLHPRRQETPADAIPDLPADAFLLCMTQGHATDRPILRRALLERSFPYLGVIGSAAKAAILRRELIADGVSPEQAARFHCPVGLPFGRNHPHEIALSIAAQLLSERDRLALPKTN